MGKVYSKIFERLGLETVVVESDGGYIGGDYCHEFVVVSDAGESRFLKTEDGTYAAHEDVAVFKHEPVNSDEEELDMKVIEQPQWVQTMDDNVKHYGKDKRHFLKNVVYRTAKDDLVIAVIRGDLEVNKTKLENLLQLAVPLEAASAEDLQAIGTKTGYVHSWGHKFLKETDRKIIYVADESLKTVKNFIGGQKTETEDTINVNYGRDFKHDTEGDIAMAQAGFKTEDGKELLEDKGIEVGNIFQLGYHYTNKMKNATFIDSDGKGKPYYMGCYGIGVGRTMATIVERFHDEKGIIWPKNVAPFKVHLVTIFKNKEDESYLKAEKLYEELLEKGVEVLFDDRKESPGKKFGDADLIGLPIRVVVSSRSLENGGAEYKLRTSDESKVMKFEDVISEVCAY
jgi:prolyl-tRNA synthetase